MTWWFREMKYKHYEEEIGCNPQVITKIFSYFLLHFSRALCTNNAMNFLNYHQKHAFKDWNSLIKFTWRFDVFKPTEENARNPNWQHFNVSHHEQKRQLLKRERNDDEFSISEPVRRVDYIVCAFSIPFFSTHHHRQTH